jgi:hypothetical protein
MGRSPSLVIVINVLTLQELRALQLALLLAALLPAALPELGLPLHALLAALLVVQLGVQPVSAGNPEKMP